MPIFLQIGMIVAKVSSTDFTLGDIYPLFVIYLFILLRYIDDDKDDLNNVMKEFIDTYQFC